MSLTAFDASGFVRFDLASGLISSAADENLTLVPRGLLALLAPGAELVAAAREWGRVHGARLAQAARDPRDPAPIEALANSLGGVLAVAGLGRVTVETRGDALLFRQVLPGGLAKSESAAGSDLLAGFIAGYLSAIDPAGFEVLPLTESGESRLFWAGSRAAVARVRGWLKEGIAPLAALDRLAPGGER